MFGALQVALLAVWASTYGSSSVKSASIAASALGLVDALVLGILSYLEHNRSVRPSSVISVFLLFTIAFDAVQCRTLWLLGTTKVLAAVSTAKLAWKLIIFALEIHEKRDILLSTWKSLSPESTSGIISRGFFWWLNDLMMRGFSATISLGSLWETDTNLQSHHLLQQIRSQGTRRKSKHALFLSVFSCLKGPLMSCIFPRICLTGFKFSQPFLIKAVINYLENHKSSDSKSSGYGLIGATALIYAGNAVCKRLSMLKRYDLLMQNT